MQRKCPECGSLEVRRSAVRVAEIALRHVFLSPYRCRDCRALFWVVSRRVYQLAALVGFAIVVGAAGVGLWAAAKPRPGDAAAPPAKVDGLETTLDRAGKSDPRAEYELATLYREGRGVPRNEKERLAWLQRAAEHGNADAQYELGMAMRDGRGIIQDYGRAAELLLQAAEAGNGLAQLELGIMYRSGIGIGADNAKAYTWLNLAAAQGVVGADVARDSVLRQLTAPEALEAQLAARRLSEAQAKRAAAPAPDK
jgi:hypothetical protein